mgnify:CR=1 FL=1
MVATLVTHAMALVVFRHIDLTFTLLSLIHI